MDTDRNLLFGVLALQIDFIDAAQFVEVCTIWTTRKNVSLADLLLEKAWITREDQVDIERLLARKLRKLGGDAKAGLAAAGDEVLRSLAALGDEEIQHSLADLPSPHGLATIAQDALPEPLERYQLGRLHATGGIGRVWLARDGNLGRDVALKELRPERAGIPAHWSRFLQEARITGQLEHPGIVPVYELCRRPGSQQPFYTMRFVKGRTLNKAARSYHQKRQAGQDQALDFLALLNAFVFVCNTIAYAHARGVIHRDLKGQNVILGDFGEVVVLDWGMAKLVDQPDSQDAETLSAPLDSDHGSGEDLTMEGQAVGTPAYMAPEQAAGLREHIGRPTDVYGLGAILYEILTGHAPFTGCDTQDVLRKVQYETPLPPCRHWPAVPQALEAACLRALAKDPGDRYPSAGELGQVVQGWQDVQRRRAEEALATERNLLRSLIDNLPDYIFVKDTECRSVLSNLAHARLLGTTPEALVGKTSFDTYPRELAERQYAADQAVLNSGQALVNHEELDRDPDGKPAWHSKTKVPLRDAQGKIIGLVGISRDITERKRMEEALRESEAFYHSLVETLPQNIFRKDLEGRLTFANQRFCSVVARPLQDIVGKTDFDLFPRDLAEKYRRDDRQVIATGKMLESVEEHVTPAGEKLYVQVIKTPIHDSRGHIIGTQGIFWDVTERQRAEAALAHERELLRTLMDNLPDHIYFKDAASRFQRINKALAAYFGLAHPADAVGKTDLDFFTAEHAQPSHADEQEIMRTGKALIGKEEKEVWLDGGVRWVSTTKMPFRDKEGQITGTFGVSRDITHWKQAEEKLAQERNLLRTLIDSLPDHIYIKDAEGRYLMDNLAHQRFLGVASAEEIVGKTVLDFFPPELAARFQADDQAILRSGTPLLDREERIISHAGQELWVATSKIPVRDSQGEITGLVCMSRDVTERGAQPDASVMCIDR